MKCCMKGIIQPRHVLWVSPRSLSMQPSIHAAYHLNNIWSKHQSKLTHSYPPNFTCRINVFSLPPSLLCKILPFILLTKVTSFTNTYCHTIATANRNWAVTHAVVGTWHHFLFSMNLLDCNFSSVLRSLQQWLILTFHCPFSVSPALSHSQTGPVSLSPFSLAPYGSILRPPPAELSDRTAPCI